MFRVPRSIPLRKARATKFTVVALYVIVPRLVGVRPASLKGELKSVEPLFQ
jgi:hypothetical protein